MNCGRFVNDVGNSIVICVLFEMTLSSSPFNYLVLNSSWRSKLCITATLTSNSSAGFYSTI